MNLYKLIKHITTVLLLIIYFPFVENVFAIAIRPVKPNSDGGININDLVQATNTSWIDMLWDNIINIHILLLVISLVLCLAYIIIWKYIYPKKILSHSFLRNVGIYFGIVIASSIILPLGYAYFEVHITNECIMNGFGQGKCTFTNLGSTKAYKCGSVEVKSYTKNEVRISNVFCSGDIPRKDTKVVEFTIPGIADICKPATGGKWSDECNLSFTDRDN